MKPIKNILVTTDFSMDSEAAVEEAALIAQKFNSTLYMLDVVNPGVPAMTGESYVPFDAFTIVRDMSIADARERLDSKVADLEKRFRIRVVADVRKGDVHDEILKEEDEKDIDLLVIAPHREHTRTGWLSKHLSERVIRDSHCPALIMYHRGEAAEAGHVFI